MLHSSPRWFSMGVPVRANLVLALTDFTALDAWVAAFLMYWGSAVMLNLFTVAAVQAMADDICENLVETAEALERADREAAEEQKRRELEEKRIKAAADREARIAKLREKVSGIVKKKEK